MSVVRYPQRIQSVHVESIDGDLCVYDTARQHVHALNHTAAFVWQRCDGRTAPAELAAALSAETPVDNAEAIVRLTLQELADAQLLAAPIDDVARVSRRDLLRRGVAAAAIPAIYSIVAPSPVAAQSAGVPTLTSVSPNQGSLGDTLVVTLTGTNFVVGATAVVVGGGGVTVANVEVNSTTSLTANFVVDGAAALGARTVTVTTAGGTSGGQAFTISPPSGSTTFTFTGSPQLFPVPAGVVSITIEATGARGGLGSAPSLPGQGGRTTATVSVTPGGSLIVRVGGAGPNGVGDVVTPGGFNGGGGSAGDGGGGGGASSVHDGATPLVIAGGGGGGGGGIGSGGGGGAGGSLTASPGAAISGGGGGGGGGTPATGGAAGSPAGPGGSAPATPGDAGTGGIGGTWQPGVFGGGGGGGGHFGGGGGGGGTGGTPIGGGGGGGSSFAAPGATGVNHQPGGNNGDGSVTISW